MAAVAPGTSLLKSKVAKQTSAERNFTWTDEEVQRFIELRIEYDEYFTGKRGSAKKGWAKVAEQLELGLGKKAPDSKQCKKKWENLAYRYKILMATAQTMCDSDGSPKVQTIHWPYFEVLHNFFSSRHMGSSVMLDASELLESPISLRYRSTSEPPERKPSIPSSSYVSVVSEPETEQEQEQEADERVRMSPQPSMIEETSERLSRAKLELTLLTIEQQRRHEERIRRLFHVRLEKEELERDILRLQLKKMRTELGEGETESMARKRNREALTDCIREAVELVLKHGHSIRQAALLKNLPFQTLARYVKKEQNENPEIPLEVIP